MNPDYKIKEEDFGDYNGSEIVKKEEETGVKVEDNNFYSALYSQYGPDTRNMTIPWNSTPYNSIPLQTNQNEPQLNPTRQWSNKPFIIIKTNVDKSYQNSCDSTEGAKTNNDAKKRQYRRRSKKKAVRVSACKNYIGLICAGFARAILTMKADSEVKRHLEIVLNQKKAKFDSLEKKTVNELTESLRAYIYKHMCGKRVKKKNTERDFKIRNTEELDKLLTITNGDTGPDLSLIHI